MPWPPERPQQTIPAIGAAGAPVRIGIISDTHIPEARIELWPQVFEAFAGVDAILHGGDIHHLKVIDQLERVAPVWSARGNGEEGSGGRLVAPADPRLRATWRLRAGELNVGLIHDLPVPQAPPKLTVANTMREEFRIDPDGPARLDVIVHGDSHVERIDLIDEDGPPVVCVNPGSPTYPRNYATRLGTVGFLEVEGRSVRATLCQLTPEGHQQIAARAFTLPPRAPEDARTGPNPPEPARSGRPR
jgi:putative phosphoesterase